HALFDFLSGISRKRHFNRQVGGDTQRAIGEFPTRQPSASNKGDSRIPYQIWTRREALITTSCVEDQASRRYSVPPEKPDQSPSDVTSLRPSSPYRKSVGRELRRSFLVKDHLFRRGKHRWYRFLTHSLSPRSCLGVPKSDRHLEYYNRGLYGEQRSSE